MADITAKVTQLFNGIQIQIQSPINVTPVVQPVTNISGNTTSIPTEDKPVAGAPIATTENPLAAQ